MHTARLLALSLLAATAACRGSMVPKPEPRPAPAPAPASNRPAPPAPAALTDSARSLLLPNGIRWVRVAAEHRVSYLQAYRLATRNVERLARESKGSWAVILDADETVLDNSPHELELARAGATYNDSNWAAWVHRADAPALPGAADFIARVRQLGGRAVIVTNRAERLCDDTRENFRRLKITVDAVLCGSGDKNPRFQSVERGTAGVPASNVLMFVGDNIQDFPDFRQRDARRAPDGAFDEFGNRYILLPNPMYGSWDRLPVP